MITDGERQASTVMGFVEWSDRMREEFIETQRECLMNYLVQPFGVSGKQPSKSHPLGISSDVGRLGGFAFLKDPESFQVVETLLAGTMAQLFPDDGYVQTRRRGVEDTFKASTVSRYLEYVLGLETHYRTMYQAGKSSFIFGTGLIMGFWDYVEGPMTKYGADYVSGFGEIPTRANGIGVYYDDPCLRNVDIGDFFPDPGNSLMPRMLAVVRRVIITKAEAERKAEQGIFDAGAVQAAIDNQATFDSKMGRDRAWREGYDKAMHSSSHPDFMPLVGYEMYGALPYTPKGRESDWGVVTVLSGITVRSDDWDMPSRRVPFVDFTVNPMDGRFYGISPLEVSRFSQDLADQIMSNLADGIVRATHPPWIVDRNAIVDTEALRRYRPSVPVLADNINGVQTLRYDPQTQAGMAMLNWTKQSIRDRGAANDAQQGMGGPDRESASVGVKRYERAGIRADAIASLFERESLPALGRLIFELGQKFIEDPADLASRIGEQPEAVALADIRADHDIKFVGSRMEANKQQRIQNMERAAAQWQANPVLMTIMPWEEWGKRYLRELDLYEIESLVNDPQTSEAQLALQMALGQQGTGNGNGAQPALPPGNILPAQLGGGVAQ